MTWGKSKILLALTTPLFFVGCFATQDDVGILKTQVAELNKTLQELQKTQADNSTQMDEFMTRLTETSDNLNNFDYKLDTISSKLDNLQASSGKNTAMLPSDIYNEAVKQAENKQYKEALTGFSLYLKATENRGVNAENAYLKSANIYYEQQDYQASAVAVATMLEKFPKGKYTASARLLYAKSILNLDKKDEAVNYLKSIVQDFKKTKEAKEAQKLLKELK